GEIDHRRTHGGAVLRRRALCRRPGSRTGGEDDPDHGDDDHHRGRHRMTGTTAIAWHETTMPRVMEQMVAHFGHDARRINHALKVFGFATVIGSHESLPEEMQEIVAYAAILHDIGIHEAERKHRSTAGIYQE